MGRAKVEMELISKQKARNATFNKRKESLVRKMHEFTTLCDVKGFMIIYGPGQEKGPEIWPNRKKGPKSGLSNKAELSNNEMTEGQLRDFALALSNKAELVREKIKAVKRSEMQTGPYYPQPPPPPIYYDYDQQMHHFVNHESMMNGQDQFGGASSSSNNIQFKPEIFYERPLQMPRHYAPPLPYMVMPPFSGGWENQDDEMKNYRG